jgi:hypothetical protein
MEVINLQDDEVDEFENVTLVEYEDKIVLAIDTQHFGEFQFDLFADNTLVLSSIETDFELQVAIGEEFTDPVVESNNGFVTITQLK